MKPAAFALLPTLVLGGCQTDQLNTAAQVFQATALAIDLVDAMSPPSQASSNRSSGNINRPSGFRAPTVDRSTAQPGSESSGEGGQYASSPQSGASSSRTGALGLGRPNSPQGVASRVAPINVPSLNGCDARSIENGVGNITRQGEAMRTQDSIRESNLIMVHVSDATIAYYRQVKSQCSNWPAADIDFAIADLQRVRDQAAENVRLVSN